LNDLPCLQFEFVLPGARSRLDGTTEVVSQSQASHVAAQELLENSNILFLNCDQQWADFASEHLEVVLVRAEFSLALCFLKVVHLFLMSFSSGLDLMVLFLL